MADDVQIPLVNPEGKLVTVSQAQAQDALAQGYTQPSAAQQKEVADRITYGQGLGNEVRAGLEGAARGLTFGLSDAAQRAVGVDPEGLKQRKERNPYSAGIGEAGGVAAGILAPIGLAGAGVRGAATLGELGAQAAARGVEAVGLEAGEGLAGKLVAKGIEKGAGSAVEGALYGAGQGVSESALGDPEDAAQTILAHATMGGVLGLGLGGAAGVLGGAGKAALANAVKPRAPVGVAEGAGALAEGVARNESRKGALQAFLEDVAGEQGLDAAGVDKRTYKALAKSRGKVLDAAATDAERLEQAEATETVSMFDEAKRIMREKNLAQAGDTVAETSQRVQGAIDEASAKARQIVEAVDAHAEKTGAKRFNLDDYADDLEQKLLKPLENRPEKEAEYAALEKRIEKYRDLARQNAPSTTEAGEVSFAEAEKLKRDFDANFASSSTTKQIAREARGIMNARIEAGVRDAAQGLEAGTFEAWKDAKRTQQALIPVRKAGEGRMAAMQANRKVSLTDYMTGLTGLGAIGVNPAGIAVGLGGSLAHKLVRERGNAVISDYANRIAMRLGGNYGARAAQLLTMESAARKVTQQVSKSADAVISALKKVPKVSTPAGVEGIHDIWLGPKERTQAARDSSGHPEDKDIAAQRPAYDRRLSEIANLAANPELLQQRLMQSTGSLQQFAPRIAAEMQVTASRAVQHLAQNAPKNPSFAVIPDARQRWRPSRADLRSFSRRLQAVNDPVGVIRDFEGGRIYKEGVEVLREIYPKLHQQFVAAIIPKLAETSGIPLQRRLELSAMLGVPLDALTDPKFSMAISAAYAAQASAAPGPPRGGGVSKNYRAEQTKTALQRALEG